LSGDGRVDANEIKRLVESRGFYMTFKEADSFLKKFDKNRDGTITYNEFREEILPKSPQRH